MPLPLFVCVCGWLPVRLCVFFTHVLPHTPRLYWFGCVWFAPFAVGWFCVTITAVYFGLPCCVVVHILRLFWFRLPQFTVLVCGSLGLWILVGYVRLRFAHPVPFCCVTFTLYIPGSAVTFGFTTRCVLVPDITAGSLIHIRFVAVLHLLRCGYARSCRLVGLFRGLPPVCHPRCLRATYVRTLGSRLHARFTDYVCCRLRLRVCRTRLHAVPRTHILRSRLRCVTDGSVPTPVPIWCTLYVYPVTTCVTALHTFAHTILLVYPVVPTFGVYVYFTPTFAFTFGSWFGTQLVDFVYTTCGCSSIYLRCPIYPHSSHTLRSRYCYTRPFGLVYHTAHVTRFYLHAHTFWLLPLHCQHLHILITAACIA